MKRAIWILACALLVAGPVTAAEPEGFGDLRWRDPAPKGRRLTQVGDSQILSERARGKTFGSVRLERVEYEFAGDRLVGVALFVKGRSGFLALKKDLETRYEAPGALTPVNPAAESYRWNGKVTSADLHYPGEGVLPVLFLSWTPSPEVPGAPAASAVEGILQHQLRLCIHMAEALDKRIVAEETRASGTRSAVDAAEPANQGCIARLQSSLRDQQTERDQQTAVEKSKTAASERSRLQKEMDRLKAELDALRAARAASAQSGAPPAAPVAPPPAP